MLHYHLQYSIQYLIGLMTNKICIINHCYFIHKYDFLFQALTDIANQSKNVDIFQIGKSIL